MSIIKIYEEFVDNELITLFEDLKNKWWVESSIYSNPRNLYTNENYKKIISLGKKIVPILISDLNTPNGDWFQALQEITGESPILEENIGDVTKMAQYWKNWYNNV